MKSAGLLHALVCDNMHPLFRQVGRLRLFGRAARWQQNSYYIPGSTYFEDAMLVHVDG